MAGIKNRDLLFKHITERIAELDFSGYTIQYPPLFIAPSRVKDREILSAWRGIARGRPARMGLYVHIPFCRQRCEYCRYFAQELGSPAELEAYLSALGKEARICGKACAGSRINSVYIGGGTPAMLSAAQLTWLFRTLARNFDLGRCRQIAFEGNPDFLTVEKLSLLKKYGVNRLTIGVQTLDPAVIKAVNRYQSAGAFEKCFRAARETGIEHINVDLLAGLPGQSMISLVSTLNAVIKLGPDMIHVHPFYPTPLCEFDKRGKKLSRKDMRLRETMSVVCNKILAGRGYGPVKFDALGKNEGARNLQLSDSVEHDAPFVGLGAGAVSHAAGRLKYVNINDAAGYVRSLAAGRLPVLSARRLTKKDEMIYFVTASLRYGSVDEAEFRALFGRGLGAVFGPQLRYLERRGKIKRRPGRVDSLMTNLGEYLVYSKYFYGGEIVEAYERDLRCKTSPADPVKFGRELRYMCL